MDKIVSRGIKIDLHIHSEYSMKKDGKKVHGNNENNLPILVQGLIDNQVEMCAITDHDNFNYNLYAKLKKEELEDNCILKVLPGIEFSVEFDKGKVLHIVTIFDDREDEKVKKIEEIMTNGIGSVYSKGAKAAYSREDYLSIMSEININFIMIVHQKNTLTSKHKPQPNDVMILGKEKVDELICMDYFDAFEFRNRKNEIFNKIELAERGLEEKVRFLTGTDCHQWACYPYSEKNAGEEFKYTYIKALPSFKGLVMAVTDYHRIEFGNSFFNPNEVYIKDIIVDIDGKENKIPLSKGLNVIIGDNSIGKSLFLNAITNYYKDIKKSVQNGYKKYCEKNKLIFKTTIKEEDIFKYNKQGEIREIFDSEGIKNDKYLVEFYPDEIDYKKYRNIADAEFERLYSSLADKFLYDENIKKLPVFNLPKQDLDEKSLTFLENVKKIKTAKLQNLISLFEATEENMEKLLKNKALEAKDKNPIQSSLDMIKIMKEKYTIKSNEAKAENDKINIFDTCLKNYKRDYEKIISDEQAINSNYIESKKIAIDSMVDLVRAKEELKEFVPDIVETPIVPETNPVDKYKFISKIQIEKIDNDYINDILRSIIRKGAQINTIDITESKLKEIIKNYPNDTEEKPLQVLKDKVMSILNSDFKVKNTIIEEGMDVYEEVSSGFDAQMYFTLISGEMRDKGLYIIDQPEDHISQPAIKSKVLGQFRRMGQQRQVLMVTHNPQFIVNLDVDNVIYLSKRDEKFQIQSGALEYENDEYNILDIVAENIDGGLQTIQGRLKRYEKNI